MLDKPSPMPPLPPEAAARLAEVGARMAALSDTTIAGSRNAVTPVILSTGDNARARKLLADCLVG